MKYYHEHRASRSWSLNAMYRCVGISKQAVHQQIRRWHRHEEEERYVLELIRQITETLTTDP